MKFVNLTLITVLLVAALASLHSAEASYLKRRLYQTKGSCNDTESKLLISDLTNVTKIPLPEDVGLLVITDSEDEIYPPLKKAFAQFKNVLFVRSLQLSFNSTLEDTYKNLHYVNSTGTTKILIHAKSIDGVAKIFEDFIKTVSDATRFAYNFAIAVTLDYDDTIDETEKMIQKLKNITANSNRIEIFEFLEDPNLYKGNIGFFSDKTNELIVNNFISSLKHSVYPIYYKIDFKSNHDIQEQITCAIQLVNKEIKNDMNQIAMSDEHSSIKTYLNKLKNTTNDDKLLHEYNGFHWHSLTLADAKDPKDFLENFLQILGKFDHMLVKQYENRNFLSRHIEVIQFLFKTTSIKNAFSSAAVEWSRPITEFKSEQTNQWIERNGIFVDKISYMDNCTNMKKRQNKFQVKGSTLLLSDINFSKCNGKVKLIELFAFKKVVIDVDLIQIGKAVQVVIIAPIWEIIGDRIINLNGENGRTQKVSVARYGSKDGYRHGAHGLAGLPGGPAGSFYGIANHIINAKSLKIFADGGNGGPGQQGGNGAVGKTGDTFIEENEETFNCDHGNVTNWNTKRLDKKRLQRSYFTAYSFRNYEIFGKEGRIGGNGGNGGAGGIGGKKGTIIIQELSKNDPNENSVIISAVNGQKGVEGAGGNGAWGGKKGGSMMVTCNVRPHGGFGIIYNKKINESLPNGPGGEEGRPGVSLKMRKTPMNQPIIQNFPSVVNEYKMYARSLLIKLKGQHRSLFYEFYDSLNTDAGITQWDDALSLVQEFIGLEEQYFHYKKQIDLTSSYVALRERIFKYFIKTSLDENAQNNKIFLRDLYQDIEDKISESKIHMEYPLVTNIKDGFKYLHDKFEEPLHEREDFEKFTVMLDAIIEPLDDKIEEAQFMIREDIQNAMNDLEITLDQEIDALLNEITQLEKKNYEKRDDLKKLREQLLLSVNAKSAFVALKVGFVALGLINPALGLAGVVVSSAISYIETAATESDESIVAAALPKSIQATATEIEKYYQERMKKQGEIFKEQEEYVEEMMSKSTESQRNEIEKVWESAAQFRESISSKSLELNVFSMENEYAEQRKDLESRTLKAIKENNKAKERDYKKGLEVAGYLQTTSKMFQAGSETAISILKDQTKMKEVQTAFRDTRNNLEKLKKFENDFYEDTLPTLRATMEDLDLTSSERINMTENQLLLNGYETRKIIGNLNHKFNDLSKNFNISEDLNWTFKKFISTFDTMEELYNKIFEHKDKKREYTFQAGLHIAHVSNYWIEDSHLRSSSAKLQVLISRNKILEAYEEFILSFKQFAFPEAADYLKKFEVPPSLMINDIKVNVSDIKREIDNLYKVVLDNYIPDKFKQKKSSKELTFYTWDKNHYKNEINNILSGEVTMLEAKNIDQIRYDALKFQNLEVLFTSKYPDIQNKIADTLKNFVVKMTHHGNSVFKCDNATYEIRHSPIEQIEFGYERRRDGQINYQSQVYSQINEGDFILSPYATWTIQLQNENPEEFKLLDQFKDHVDLEFAGMGLFMSKWDKSFKNVKSHCGNNTNLYYTKLPEYY